ncbi:hypothetical protein WPG_2214 [Winogradskyella sp. PG-2]|nr:hypothetical protein WPG_2214 [Winogradskyella sp. PG-2]
MFPSEQGFTDRTRNRMDNMTAMFFTYAKVKFFPCNGVAKVVS